MTQSHQASFYLRDDFHKELGWEDLVRDQAYGKPSCIGQILAHPARFILGPDPRTRLERWEPFMPGFMFYFWLVRAGDSSPSFVASDALFSMILTPLPDEAHLAGLPGDLLELGHEALTPSGAVTPWPSPLLPRRPEGEPAVGNLFPALLIMHRYPVARATLLPCVETLQALGRDPLAWCARQPRLPGLWG